MSGQQLFWGELHTHTLLSDGNGTAEENFEIARSHLDFWAMADHAVDPEVFSAPYLLSAERPLLSDNWQQVQELCRTYETPGKFIPFLAYEWTNFQYGHHNVYYLEYDQPIRMPATLNELYDSLRGLDAFVIPHHTGYAVGTCGKDWDYHDEELSPFVELYSLHGSSEEPGGIEPMLTTGSWMGPGGNGGSVQEGLARGYKLGIMASSDSHAEHPGAYDCGLIAAYADELTRKSLWEAFRNKRIYGVTGDRIALDFHVNGRPMGSTLACDGPRTIDVSVVGWDRIDRIDIIKNNELLHSFVEPLEHPTPRQQGRRLRFLLQWGWDKSADNNWGGTLKIAGGRIVQAIPCYRGRAAYCIGKGVKTLSEAECRWTSRTAKHEWGHATRKFTNTLAIEVECTDETKLDFVFSCGGRERSWSMSPQEITQSSPLIYMAEVPKTNDGSSWGKMKSLAKAKVHRGWWTDQLTLNLSYTDEPTEQAGLPTEQAGEPSDEGDKRTDFYYVRVIQHNGQRAWSSPVWVERHTT